MLQISDLLPISSIYFCTLSINSHTITSSVNLKISKCYLKYHFRLTQLVKPLHFDCMFPLNKIHYIARWINNNYWGSQRKCLRSCKISQKTLKLKGQCHRVLLLFCPNWDEYQMYFLYPHKKYCKSTLWTPKWIFLQIQIQIPRHNKNYEEIRTKLIKGESAFSSSSTEYTLY